MAGNTHKSSSSLHNVSVSAICAIIGCTHLEPAFILTVSLTCCKVVGCTSLDPPVRPKVRPTVPKRVPRARYSVLIARPKMTLE